MWKPLLMENLSLLHFDFEVISKFDINRDQFLVKTSPKAFTHLLLFLVERIKAPNLDELKRLKNTGSDKSLERQILKQIHDHCMRFIKTEYPPYTFSITQFKNPVNEKTLEFLCKVTTVILKKEIIQNLKHDPVTLRKPIYIRNLRRKKAGAVACIREESSRLISSYNSTLDKLRRFGNEVRPILRTKNEEIETIRESIKMETTKREFILEEIQKNLEIKGLDLLDSEKYEEFLQKLMAKKILKAKKCIKNTKREVECGNSMLDAINSESISANIPTIHLSISDFPNSAASNEENVFDLKKMLQMLAQNPVAVKDNDDTLADIRSVNTCLGATLDTIEPMSNTIHNFTESLLNQRAASRTYEDGQSGGDRFPLPVVETFLNNWTNMLVPEMFTPDCDASFTADLSPNTDDNKENIPQQQQLNKNEGEEDKNVDLNESFTNISITDQVGYKLEPMKSKLQASSPERIKQVSPKNSTLQLTPDTKHLKPEPVMLNKSNKSLRMTASNLDDLQVSSDEEMDLDHHGKFDKGAQSRKFILKSQVELNEIGRGRNFFDTSDNSFLDMLDDEN